MSAPVPLGVPGQVAADPGRQLSDLQGEAGAEGDQGDKAGGAHSEPDTALVWGQDTDEAEVRYWRSIVTLDCLSL